MDENWQVKLEAFRAWFTSNGGHIHKDVQLTYTTAKGVHFLLNPNATKLPPGTCLISCPHSLTLSALNADGRFALFPPGGPRKDSFAGGSAMGGFPSSLKEQAPIASCMGTAWLCIQHALYEQSFWAPYIGVLPRLTPDGAADTSDSPVSDRGLGEIDIPILWSDDEREWFKSSPLDKGTSDREALVHGECGEWLGLVSSWARQHGLEIDKDLYRWAWINIGARAFSASHVKHTFHQDQPLLSTLNPHSLLYPGIDMLNHAPDSKNLWLIDSEKVAVILYDDVLPGEEITHSYGPKDNGHLMLSYGFTIPRNPNDTFPLLVNRPPDNHLEALMYPVLSAQMKSSSEQYDDLVHARLEHLSFSGQASLLSSSKRQPWEGPSQIQFSLRNHSHTHNLPDYPSLTHLPHDPLSPTTQSPTTFQPKEILLSGLTGAPLSLLNRLSSMAASPREARFADTHAAQLAHGSHGFLAGYLGLRNMLAVAGLLHRKLAGEANRLAPVLQGLPPPPSAPSTRHERRLGLAHSYMADLHELVSAQADRLGRAIRTALDCAPDRLCRLSHALQHLPRTSNAGALSLLLRGMGAPTPDSVTHEQLAASIEATVAKWHRRGQAEEAWLAWIGGMRAVVDATSADPDSDEFVGHFRAWSAGLEGQMRALLDDGEHFDHAAREQLAQAMRHFGGVVGECRARQRRQCSLEEGIVDVWGEGNWTEERLRFACFAVMHELVPVEIGTGKGGIEQALVLDAGYEIPGE